MPKSDPAQFAAQGLARLTSAFRPAMEELGKDMQTDMRQLISVTVQYVAHGSSRPTKPNPIGSKPGPGLTQTRGVGQTVVRSKKGEPPRKEFGLLYKSMVTSTAVNGDRITTTMGSDDSIAGYAERLEERMDRPHFKTIYERYERLAADRIRRRSPSTI